jgi:hypothetical protein
MQRGERHAWGHDLRGTFRSGGHGQCRRTGPGCVCSSKRGWGPSVRDLSAGPRRVCGRPRPDFGHRRCGRSTHSAGANDTGLPSPARISACSPDPLDIGNPFCSEGEGPRHAGPSPPKQ